jgi:hypothetical protein
MSPTTNNLTFFCTNTAFLLSQIPLASFVPKKKQPYQDVEKPYQVIPKDYSARPDEAYNISKSSSSDNIFSILATKFASVSYQQSEATAMHVSAVKGGKVYTLDNPDGLFEKIVFGEDHGEYMQTWFERCVRKKWKPRFVVGLRTLVDASVSDDVHKTTDDFAAVTAPISSAQGDPFGVVDMEFRAERQSKTDTQAGLRLPSERIYSICYWKIHISHREGKVAPELKSQKNVWRSFYSSRGGSDKNTEEDSGEELYQAELEGHDREADGWGIREMKALDGRTIRFALDPKEDDDDKDDDCLE